MKLNRKRCLKLHLPKHIINILNKKKLFWGKLIRYETEYNKKVMKNISKVCSKALFDFNKEQSEEQTSRRSLDNLLQSGGEIN